MGRMVVLSKRLQMLARLVTPGNRAADVGCDHGFLSVYLVQAGISPGVIAMDVRKGPLAAASRHIRDWGLEAYIEVRLSDGLNALAPGEAESLVCAGMGGRLMERLLTRGLDKARGMRELVLQPQSELSAFRQFLRRAGFVVTAEDMVFEEGKYYFAMRAAPGEGSFSGGEDPRESLYDRFGEKLLSQRHPLLPRFLRQQEALLERLSRQMQELGSERAKMRLTQIEKEREYVRQALDLFELRRFR